MNKSIERLEAMSLHTWNNDAPVGFFPLSQAAFTEPGLLAAWGGDERDFPSWPSFLLLEWDPMKPVLNEYWGWKVCFYTWMVTEDGQQNTVKLWCMRWMRCKPHPPVLLDLSSWPLGVLERRGTGLTSSSVSEWMTIRPLWAVKLNCIMNYMWLHNVQQLLILHVRYYFKLSPLFLWNVKWFGWQTFLRARPLALVRTTLALSRAQLVQMLSDHIFIQTVHDNLEMSPCKPKWI